MDRSRFCKYSDLKASSSDRNAPDNSRSIRFFIGDLKVFSWFCKNMISLRKHRKNLQALHKMSLQKIVARLPERAKFLQKG